MNQGILDSACQAFQMHFGHSATMAGIAPGRVNLMGDHTDYSGGLAMPCAIDRYTLALAGPAPRADGSVHLLSTQHPDSLTILPGNAETEPKGDWADYLRGVRHGYAHRGIMISGMDVLITGDLPLGAGLSSSAALELSFACLLEQASGVALPVRERALLCQHAEATFAGMPCGILDQFAISFGHADTALMLDCRSETFEHTPLQSSAGFLVIDSGTTHVLADGGYAERRQAIAQAEAALGRGLRDAHVGELHGLESGIRARARHVISENSRVLAFAGATQAEDWSTAGRLMVESHASMRDDFENSCVEIDWLVERTVQAGAWGARMTGGGFGGSVVCLVAAQKVEAIKALVSGDYPQATGCTGTVREVKAVDGATCLTLEPIP